MRQFLKKSGLGYRKARGVPAKEDPVVQKQFIDETLQPLLNQATAGKRKVFFVDAAHFVRGAFLAYLWCYVRWIVPTRAGRQRYSVLAALDAVSRSLICETTDGTVDQVTVGRLLLKIRDAYPSWSFRSRSRTNGLSSTGPSLSARQHAGVFPLTLLHASPGRTGAMRMWQSNGLGR